MTQESMLNFEEIENSFPDGALTDNIGRCVVSAQWLHEFANNIHALGSETALQQISDFGQAYPTGLMPGTEIRADQAQELDMGYGMPVAQVPEVVAVRWIEIDGQGSHNAWKYADGENYPSHEYVSDVEFLCAQLYEKNLKTAKGISNRALQATAPKDE